MSKVSSTSRYRYIEAVTVIIRCVERLERGQFREGKIGVQRKPRKGACTSMWGCHKAAENT